MIDISSAPMQMPNAAEDIWLPQKHILGSYHHQVPPDVVPQYDDSNDWHTIPRTNIPKKNTNRPPSFDGTGNVKLKDYIELTKTVKNSLILSENEEMHVSAEKLHFPPERPPMHSTYKMPPLTPTVANLIHTSSVVKKSYSSLGSSSKVMKPVYGETVEAHANQFVQDGPELFMKRSYTTSREHRNRNGPRLPNRNHAMREERIINQIDETDQEAAMRYSWNCATEETSTNFGKPLVRSSYSAGTMPTHLERKQSANKMKPVVPLPKSTNYSAPVDHQPFHNNAAAVSAVTNYYPAEVYAESVNYSPTSSASHSPVLEQSTSFSKSTLRKNSAAPPPPPRRSPNTKLSKSGLEKRNNSSTNLQPSTTSPSNRSSVQTMSYDNRQLAGSSSSTNTRIASPERDLPTLPPSLPLYNSHAQSKRDNKRVINPNSINLPAPPPPPNSIYDKPIQKHENLQKIPSRGTGYDFPPPPSLM